MDIFCMARSNSLNKFHVKMVLSEWSRAPAIHGAHTWIGTYWNSGLRRVAEIRARESKHRGSKSHPDGPAAQRCSDSQADTGSR